MKQFTNGSLFLLLGSILFLVSCRSVDEIAIAKISDMMSSDSGAGAFTRDDDPQLVADALPFALKMYEMLIELNPEDASLRLAAGRTFIMYANAFIQTPAVMLPDEEWEEQELMLRRARNMYLRGRDYVLSALTLEIDEFDSLLETDLDTLLNRSSKDQASSLYWAAAGWLGAFSCDPFDMELGSRVYIPVTFLYRALELNESLERGALHDLLITIWSSVPRGIIEKGFMETPSTAGAFSTAYYERQGIDQKEESRARFHLGRAVELTEGLSPSPYLSFAVGIPVMQQNYDEFEGLLKKALAIDPMDDPANELLTVLFQEKAKWYLEHREDYFLLDF